MTETLVWGDQQPFIGGDIWIFPYVPDTTCFWVLCLTNWPTLTTIHSLTTWNW